MLIFSRKVKEIKIRRFLSGEKVPALPHQHRQVQLWQQLAVVTAPPAQVWVPVLTKRKYQIVLKLLTDVEN